MLHGNRFWLHEWPILEFDEMRPCFKVSPRRNPAYSLPECLQVLSTNTNWKNSSDKLGIVYTRKFCWLSISALTWKAQGRTNSPRLKTVLQQVLLLYRNHHCKSLQHIRITVLLLAPCISTSSNCISWAQSTSLESILATLCTVRCPGLQEGIMSKQHLWPKEHFSPSTLAPLHLHSLFLNALPNVDSKGFSSVIQSFFITEHNIIISLYHLIDRDEQQ